MKLIFLIILFLGPNQSNKFYTKLYYPNGNMMAEGWSQNDVKTDYWYFYSQNGKIKEEGSFQSNEKTKYWKHYDDLGNKIMEGRYKNGLATDWWVFYENNEVDQKAEFVNGKKNGFVFFYIKGEIVKAAKYKDDVKIGQWTDLKAFKRDNL